MNIKNILSFILVKYNNDNKVSDNIIKDIQETIIEIEVAESMFNSVSDSKLIEAAIYREEAAKKKFDYLLSVAKEQNSKNKVYIEEKMEI